MIYPHALSDTYTHTHKCRHISMYTHIYTQIHTKTQFARSKIACLNGDEEHRVI